MTTLPSAPLVYSQVLGAQFSPESEEEGAGGERGEQKISPWGYLVYRNTPNINMINMIGNNRLPEN